MAERVISKLIECIEWLDNHFTISKEQLESTLGRSVSRMDSNIIVAVEDLIRPC
jgi:hypothetical protein